MSRKRKVAVALSSALISSHVFSLALVSLPCLKAVLKQELTGWGTIKMEKNIRDKSYEDEQNWGHLLVRNIPGVHAAASNSRGAITNHMNSRHSLWFQRTEAALMYIQEG